MHPKSFVGRALPGPAGSLQRSPDPLAGFKGAYFKEGEGMERLRRGGVGRGGLGRGGLGRGELGREGKGRGDARACPLYT